MIKDRWLRNKYARCSLSTGQGSAILMFHHIAETCPEGVSQSCYSSIDDFKTLLINLGQIKQFVTLSSICNELENGIVPKDKIVVTFDDVPINVYYNAVPILREHKIPYVLYISIGLVGEEGYLSKNQIIELSKDPLCTIGSHTVSHCKLKHKEVNLYNELSTSKQILEDWIDKPVEHFAYPYGTPFAISKKVIERTKLSGLYKSAVCTIPAYLNENQINNMFSLPRIHSQLFINNYLNKK